MIPRFARRFQTLPVAAVSAAALIVTGCANAVPPPRASAPPPPLRTAQRPAVQPWRPAPMPAPAPVPYRPAVGAERPPAGLEATIDALWRGFPGRTGIAVRRIDGNWSLARRGDEFFPQQSVSKLWVTLTTLAKIDAGQGALFDQVTITGDDLTLFNQPLARRVQSEGIVRESVDSLIDKAITGSDNTANEALLRYAGGPDAVRGFLGQRGITGIRFGPGERLLQSRIAGVEWQQRYSAGRGFEAARGMVPLELRQAALNRYLANPEDGAQPQAVVDALAALARGELLSPASTRRVIDTMHRTTSGPQRLKAGVPPGWRVAHKTGTGQVLGSLATGYNDIGILTAPDGTRYAVAVMLASTTAPVPERMALMQAVSRAVADYHMR